MKPTTLLLGLGALGVGYYLWDRSQRAPSAPSAGSAPSAESPPSWRVEDLPPSLQALPVADQRVAGEAFYSRDPARQRAVAVDLRGRGYAEAAAQLELRAMLVEASELSAPKATAFPRLPWA